MKSLRNTVTLIGRAGQNPEIINFDNGGSWPSLASLPQTPGKTKKVKRWKIRMAQLSGQKRFGKSG